MEVPLFPLHTVLCPGVALPLHIFEPRYREMTERCLAEGSPFGVVLIREGREVGTGALALAGVGTLAEIREAGRDEDGRFDLLVVGTRRFSIDGVSSDREPYLIGEVSPLDEVIGDVKQARRLTDRVTRRFITYLELMQPQEGERVEELDVQVEVDVVEDDPEQVDPNELREAAFLEGASDEEAGLLEGDPLRGGLGHPATGGFASGDPRDREQMARLDDAARRLTIPDDPTVLSYLLSGIVQVELPRRQELLQAATTADRLTALGRILEREIDLLRRRLRNYSPDGHLLASRKN
jgi:Lon protease-like protein